jgi:hypothetical protein
MALPMSLAAGALVGLVVTNPDGQAFEAFAAERLTALLSEELCGTNGLPMLARLMIRDCPALVASQRDALGQLALARTRRRNLGLFSLYRTELAGQALFGFLQVPEYSAITLGMAGRFLILYSEESSDREIRR